MDKHIFSFLSPVFAHNLSKTNSQILRNHLGSLKKLLNKRLKELPTLDPIQFYRILETHLSLLCFMQGLQNLLQNPKQNNTQNPIQESPDTLPSPTNEADILHEIQDKIKKFQEHLN